MPLTEGAWFALYDEDKMELYCVAQIINGRLYSKSKGNPNEVRLDDNMYAQLYNPSNICAIKPTTAAAAIESFKDGKTYKFTLPDPDSLVWDIWIPI